MVTFLIHVEIDEASPQCLPSVIRRSGIEKFDLLEVVLLFTE